MHMDYSTCYDVVVAGGGVSGITAAVAAARNGARVLVVEQSGSLGGSWINCGVGPMMTFHAGEKQVIRGLAEEIVQRLVRGGWSCGHVKDTTQYISYLTPFDYEGMKLVLDQMACEAGCAVLFHTFIGAVTAREGAVQNLTLCNKDGLHEVCAKVFVDATGDGDVAAWAGATMTKGRTSDGAAQPLTLKMRYCNVDTAALKTYVLENLHKFSRLVHNEALVRSPQPLALAGFDEVFQRAKQAGEVQIPREDILFFETNRPGEYIVNTTRIIGHDATSAASLSDAELEGRKQCAQLDVFLRKYVPGFAGALLEFTGPSVGVRGSRQLVGTYTLTAQDILTRKSFDSVIAHSAYPIDIHNPSGEGTASTFMSEPGTYYSIPYEVMTTPALANLLVTGRCISTTFEAQAAIRTTPTVCALGQACGVAAAMAAQHGDVRTIDIARLQQTLLEQGAYLDLAH